ncbi:hypothetical protein HNR46_001536 [Haloferula luteola]|uniref:Uncharacterized protein n=1 Tax=Haloferula luteola TaxID=595692 RepID=A0A840VBJ0_9BACT|nr:hypothetical protein [Haloferula luteola]MBB5351300.1 hypothetical protein [Haloferula luteola]
MANILAIISAVLLAASAYIAFKNKSALETEVDRRSAAESTLSQNQATLTGLQGDRDDTIATREDVESQTLVKKDEETATQTTNAELKSGLEEKKSESEKNAARISDIKAQTDELGDIQEIAGKIRRLKEEIASAEDSRTSLKATQANLLSERNGTQEVIADYNKINRDYSNKNSFFESAQINSIFGPWGFVTISAGNSAGAVAGSTLSVVRDGETIAKLRVRTVEAGRASADVIPGSLAEDTTLMVGDLVKPVAAETSEGN